MRRGDRPSATFEPGRIVRFVALSALFCTKTNAILQAQPCSEPGTYMLGWSLEPILGGEVWDERLLGEPFVDGDSLVVSKTFSLYVNAVSNQVEQGIQGWSIGVEVTGIARIRSFSTDGTAADPAAGFFDRGFRRTGRTDCFRSARCAVWSTVILCFDCPATLPVSNTETLLQVGVSVGGRHGDEGRVFFTEDFEGVDPPITNTYAVAGESVAPCNKDVAVLDLIHEPCRDPDNYAFGWSLEPIHGGEVWDERLIGEPFIGRGKVQVPEFFSLYANAVSKQAEEGIQGWSIAVEATGNVDFVGVSTDSTAADPALGFFNGGFNKTFLWDGFGRNSVTSAVVLCFGCPLTLPLDTTESLLRIDGVLTGADAMEDRVMLVDGLVGGQATKNVFTVFGKSVVACNRRDVDLELIPQDQNCHDLGTHSFGWSLEPILDGEAWDERLIGEPFTGAGAARVPTSTSVYANTVSHQVEVGIQGWSLGVRSSGYAQITEVTTQGTAADPEQGFHMGGFDKTFLAFDELAGRTAATSSVVLCFGCPVTLGLDGTWSLLRIDVSLDLDLGVTEGRIELAEGFFCCDQDVRIAYTIAGKSVRPCNWREAILSLAPLPIFRRGDSNGDGDVDIADAIWTIAELFLDGAPSPCPPAADANGDVTVDLADVTYLLNFNFVGGPPPPEPFVECGETFEDCATSCSR